MNREDIRAPRDVESMVFGMLRDMDILAMLYAAVETGVLEMIRKGDVQPGENARGKSRQPAALETLLNALAASNFIREKENKYELCPITERLLDNPFLVSQIKLAKVYSAIFQYPGRLKGEYRHVLSSSDLEAITSLGRYSAPALVQCLARLIPPLQTEPLSLLDIGCGQGFHLIYLSFQNPKLECTGIDANENILRLARKNIASARRPNIILQKGDLREGDFGKDLDVITIFTSLRGIDREELAGLARKVFASLKKGGYFVIQDFFLENHRLEPLENVYFDMKLALSEPAGRVFQRSDFEKIRDEGFAEFRFFPLKGKDIPVKDSAFFIYRK